MRRRFSYANVAATLALVFAMSGGAYAAGHYLINSTKQINPKVLRKLHGARGARGAVGPIGAVGPQGVTGATGRQGPRGPDGEPGFSALSQLPSGKTESGDFALTTLAEKEGEPVSTAVTFSVPLSVAIPAEHVEFRTATTPVLGKLPRSRAGQERLAVRVHELHTQHQARRRQTAPDAFNPEASPAVGSGRYGVGFNWEAGGGRPS